MASDFPALFTVEEVAEKLGISKYQVYRRIDRGDLKATRFRRRVGNTHSSLLVTEQSLNAYIAEGGPKVLSPPRRPVTPWMSTREVSEVTGYDQKRIRELCLSDALVYRRGNGNRGQYWIFRDSVNAMISDNG